MYCGKCGISNLERAKFCRECGADMSFERDRGKFGKGFFKQMSILISIVSGVILSAILGLLSTEAIVTANMISVPKFSLPLFNVGSILIIAPVALVTFMEHIGDITTNGTVVGKDFISDPGLNRTLMGDGLATAFAGLVGGAPNTTYGENTATLELTKNFNKVY